MRLWHLLVLLKGTWAASTLLSTFPFLFHLPRSIRHITLCHQRVLPRCGAVRRATVLSPLVHSNNTKVESSICRMLLPMATPSQGHLGNLLPLPPTQPGQISGLRHPKPPRHLRWATHPSELPTHAWPCLTKMVSIFSWREPDLQRIPPFLLSTTLFRSK